MARDIRLNRWGLNQSANEHVCKTSKACVRGLGWSMSLETQLSESWIPWFSTARHWWSIAKKAPCLMYPSAYAHSTRFLSFSHAWVNCIRPSLQTEKNITYPVVYSLPTLWLVWLISKLFNVAQRYFTVLMKKLKNNIKKWHFLQQTVCWVTEITLNYLEST